MNYYSLRPSLFLILLILLAPAAQAGVMATLFPEHSQLKQLEEALTNYRAMASKEMWVEIPQGRVVTPGMSDPRIVKLRKRLTQEHFLKNAGSGTIYDKSLQEAVKQFQNTHGITPDGVINKKTIAALNVPLSRRIVQIAINIERWKSLPDRLGERYIMVNIAGFQLQAIDHDKSVLTMRIIAGKPTRKTPVFMSVISDVVFHPYWHVPRDLAVDKLPLIRKDPNYLSKHEFVVLDRSGHRVVPEEVDWNAVSKSHFPYSLRQNPGDLNALGKIRFSLVNPMDIYMHGTPEQKLFSHKVRAESSGCIRVEDPLKLAYFVLDNMKRWNPERIEKVYAGEQKTLQVPLQTPLPIYILYFTSWVDPQGQLQFRDDIYGWDIYTVIPAKVGSNDSH